MLQHPINVYPDKTAFATADSNYYRGIQLTFQGDMLSSLYWRLYNYDTGAIALENKIYGEQMRPICYNNGKVEIPNIFTSLGVGRYVMQFMMTQTRVDQDDETPNRINVHDRFVSRGKLVQAYVRASQTSIVIEDNIRVIYEWNKNGSVYSANVITDEVDTPNFTHRASEIVIKIGNETVPIVSYDASTGVATLAYALANDYPADTSYQLYANYLISELYYFEVAYQPELQPVMEDSSHNPIWVEWGAYGGTFRGFFWQGDTSYNTQGGTMIKYYTYELYKIDSDEKEWLIQKSDKIFSQNVTFDFVDDYDDIALSGDYHYQGTVDTIDELPSDADVGDAYLNEWNDRYYVMTEDGWGNLEDCGGNYHWRQYKLYLHCALQNGMELDTDIEFTSPERDEEENLPHYCVAVPDEDNNYTRINIRGGHVTGAMRFRVYRVNESANKYYNAPYKELIADINYLSFVDYIVGNHEKYRYMIVPYDTVTGNAFTPIVTGAIENNFYGYTITALHDTGEVYYGKPLYLAGDNWKLMAEIEDTDNVQNLNRVMHVGNGKYATVTATENNYISGSLTAEIGKITCADKVFRNDASVMAEWREFIAQDCPFILRSQKGDVWLVRITDGGSIQYEEDTRKISSTVTFSWVECGSIYDYLIQEDRFNDRR